VVFGLRIGDVQAWLQAVLAMMAFCFASSSAYIINDIHDRHQDRMHPRKKTRPLASGAVSIGLATVTAIVFLAAAMAAAQSVNLIVSFVVLTYLLLQFVYTFFLKSKMLIDVICIASGFVLRAVGGAVAIGVAISPWLFVCTFTICLFVGFCKRRSEIVSIGDTSVAEKYRKTLVGYVPELLTHLTTLSAGVAIVSFLVYASSPRTVEHFGTDYLVYTLPAVIYAVCRFAMLSMTGRFADPMDLIFHDRPLQVTAGILIISTLVVIYWGREIQGWIQVQY